MKTIIYGNGKIAKIIYQFLKKEYTICCFTVDTEQIKDKKIEDLQVIPFDMIEKLFPPESHNMIIAVGYLEMNQIRRLKFNEVKDKGYKLINYIHPSVHIHENINIGEGNVLLDHVTINPEVIIGNNNFIWSNAVIAHGCEISNHCWIASGVTVAGESKVGNGCFIGINSAIGNNINLGNETFVGANSLITKNTEEYSVYINQDTNKVKINSRRFLNIINNR